MSDQSRNKILSLTTQPGITRVLTGIKPTGDMHLGNFFGAMKPAIEQSQNGKYEVVLMCADWHGLTDRAKILEPGKNTAGILAVLLTMGFDASKNSLILQSQFPQIQENAWYLSCSTLVGLLERAHAYKDALANGKDASAGLLYYPVLMASDILTFDAEVVPVGKDQSQHLEYTSDLAKLFNNSVQAEVFTQPRALIQETPLLIGIDGERKMSKSYGNDIPLFASKKEIEKRVKEIKTDSKGLDDVKDPATCAIFQIFKAFASSPAQAHMYDRLSKGVGYGYGHAKKDFMDEYDRVFGSKREEYEHYVNNPQEIRKKMEPGFERAQKYASAVRQRARDALGLW